MANPNANFPGFETTYVNSSVGYFRISGVSAPTQGYVMNFPLNPADYSTPDLEQSSISTLDGAPVFQFPPQQGSSPVSTAQEGQIFTASWPYVSYPIISGCEPFLTRNAYGERPRVRIFDEGFNFFSGIDAEVINLRKQVLPGFVPLRFSLVLEFIRR